MKTVYLLYSETHNYCDTWTNVIGIYGAKADAVKEQSRLERAQTTEEKEFDSFQIVEMPVL